MRALLLLLMLSVFAACAATAEDSMNASGPSQALPLSFTALERTGRPNDALAAPEGFVAEAADIVSPRFALSADELLEVARETLTKQPRTSLVASFSAERQLALEQRTALFGFRDSIWLQTIESNEGSSLLIYSRSNVGYWDLGANRARIGAWLEAIDEAVKARQP